jgi:hypothetical protein
MGFMRIIIRLKRGVLGRTSEFAGRQAVHLFRIRPLGRSDLGLLGHRVGAGLGPAAKLPVNASRAYRP